MEKKEETGGEKCCEQEKACAKKSCCSSKKSGCSSKNKPKKKTHDSRISSVAIVLDDDVDTGKLDAQLGRLVEERSEKLYRYKGVIAAKGSNHKYVFQGVHMLLNTGFIPGSRWKEGEKRQSKLVFIGVDLDHAELQEMFHDCKAEELRFDVGDLVLARTRGWMKGAIIKTWDDGHPYRVRLESGAEVWAPKDTDQYIQKRDDDNVA